MVNSETKTLSVRRVNILDLNLNLQYGSATLEGQILADDVCIDPLNQYCSKNFTFLGITKQEGFDDADGILGLSPDIPQNGPSFVQKLREANLIDFKIVSFFVGYNTH